MIFFVYGCKNNHSIKLILILTIFVYLFYYRRKPIGYALHAVYVWMHFVGGKSRRPRKQIRSVYIRYIGKAQTVGNFFKSGTPFFRVFAALEIIVAIEGGYYENFLFRVGKSHRLYCVFRAGINLFFLSPQHVYAQFHDADVPFIVLAEFGYVVDHLGFHGARAGKPLVYNVAP